jgi:two-component system phosphate regulon sensor histidine kinase PhoR
VNNAWSVEYWRLVLVIIAALLIGILTGYWYIAWLLPLSLYSGWQLRQLYLLERWLSGGAKTKKAPESNGVWALIVQQVYRRKQQQQKQKKRLATMLNRFSAMASALPDATIVLNKHHEIEWANQASEDILGIDRKRDPGLRIETIIRNPEFHLWMKEAKTQKDLEMVSPVDQHKILALLQVKFGKGKLLLTARDISQRVQLQQMRKTFVANASHELRTPLTVIAGYLEILETTDNLPEDLRAPVANASAQAQRMQQIVEGLLSLSQAETADLTKQNREPLKVAMILQQLNSELQNTLALNTHRLILTADSTIRLHAAETEVTSVAQNLIKNAIRHTPAGTNIEISWQRNEAGGACLQVKDDGPGINAAHLPKLTERFYRVDAGRAKQTGGTGLGLSIVKHIMQSHGGTLEIESIVGSGSSFTACFPTMHVVD